MKRVAWIGLVALLGARAAAAERGEEYLAVVRHFADTLLDKGRDHYGPKQTALWCGVINVEDYSVPESAKEVPATPGVREKDRSVGGCNLYQDVSAIHAFRALSKVVGDERYAQATRDYMRDYIKVAQSPVTGQLAWGEHAYYDVFKDKVAGPAIHELLEWTPPWELMWEVNPEGTSREITALKYHFCAEDPGSAGWMFNRHADLGKIMYQPADFTTRTRSMPWIKHSGLYACSYAFLASKASSADLTYREKGIGELYWNHRDPKTDLVQSCLNTPQTVENGQYSDLQNSMLCYYLLKTARMDPANGAAREHALAMLKALDHYHWDPAKNIYRYWVRTDGTPVATAETAKEEAANPWTFSYGEGMIPRYGRIMAYAARTEKDDTCRAAAIRVAGLLKAAELPASFTPEEIGFGIQLNLDLYELTAERGYLEEADRLGKIAVEKLYANGLIRRGPGEKFYEAKVGPGDLAAGLLRLSLRLEGKPDPEGIYDWSF
ncbi:MAG TPA: hypothetical protein VH253_20485 [Phycisphaerae bacterium]|nr:hypothetical protein [Phycisphaerae bacterium]